MSGNNCVQMTQKGYIQLGSITALVNEIDGQAPLTNMTTYAYNGNLVHGSLPKRQLGVLFLRWFASLDQIRRFRQFHPAR